jgi:hypothetical protein
MALGMSVPKGIYDVSPTPFTDLILDFRGRNLTSEEIESDYNSTLNYPNNYFVAPQTWRECFYTVSRKSMLHISRGIENIVRVKPPFNKFSLYACFQAAENFTNVKEQYEEISSLTKSMYIIGPPGIAAGSTLYNTTIIENVGSGLERNWIVMAVARDEGCALVAEEIGSGKYRGLFTTNLNLVNRSVAILRKALPLEDM